MEGAGFRLHASLGHGLLPEHTVDIITSYPVMNLPDLTFPPKLFQWKTLDALGQPCVAI